MTLVRLAPPSALAAEPELDPGQRAAAAIVAEPDNSHLLVVGEAGSGKTTLAVALAAEAVATRRLDPSGVLVLAPTRRAAGMLRDRLSSVMGTPTGSPMVRSAASLAWAILRAEAVGSGAPTPILVSGAEQDEILRDLLDGHLAGLVTGPSWEGTVVPEATALAGFRAELRDLIMRAEEAGLAPADLRRLGERCGRDDWVAASAVFQEYERTMALRSTPVDQGARYDPASVVAEAARVLASWDPTVPLPVWPLVVVDDAQDATRATWALLRALAERGSRIVLLGNADECVQGYRGAVPHVIADAVLERPEGLGAAVITLAGTYRSERGLAELARAIASRIPTVREFSARLRPEYEPSDSDSDSGANGGAEGLADPHGIAWPVDIIVSPHATAEARALAARFRAYRRGIGGTPITWGSMAVIARTSARARELRAGLVAAGIPCATVGEGVALHREPAVAPLLTLARVALGEPWTSESAMAVLTSRAVGLDGAGIRRLRRALAAEQQEGAHRRSGMDLLLEELAVPASLATLRGRDATRSALVARAVADGREAGLAGGATAGSVLWAIWARLGVAEEWRRAALAGSTVDDADLDAVIALFRAADQHAERIPEAPPAAFLQYLAGQDFAVDSLSPRAAVADAVAVETPASAAGREWEVVAIAGLEDGVWPNLRLRDSVLGSAHLTEVLAGRSSPEPLAPDRRERIFRAARASVLADETRTLLVAVTRARRAVIALTRESELDRPSRFVSWLDGGRTERRISASDVPGLADLRDAVVALRSDAVLSADSGVPGSDAGPYAAWLAALALLGAPGANPETWHGVREPSSAQALWEASERVRVSPSKVESIETCPLRAALEGAGGRDESSPLQRLGTLVHEAAARYPHGPIEAMLEVIDAGWATLGLPANWIGARERERAGQMASRLVAYSAAVAAEGWTVATEQSFRVDIGRAILAGRADRLHTRGDEARVVDLKTARNAVTRREAEENPQLAMYQVAVEHGGFPDVNTAAGAELVFLGAPGDPVRRQGAIDDGAGLARLDAIIDTLSRPSFDAHPSRDCRTCPVRRSCPAQPEGRQVTEG